MLLYHCVLVALLELINFRGVDSAEDRDTLENEGGPIRLCEVNSLSNYFF